MAKFRFPGKALKLNTRKRVRFRGSYAGNTPEELYTRKIRKGLDLFTKIYGDSEEDEEDFEGFTSIHPEHPDPRTVCPAGETAAPDSPKPRGSKRQAAQRVEEAFVVMQEAGLVTRRRASAVDQALRELREGEERKKDKSEGRRKDTSEGRRKDPNEGKRKDPNEGKKREVCEGKKRDVPVCAARTDKMEEDDEGGSVDKSRTVEEVGKGSVECVQGSKAVVVASTKHVTQKHTNHRLSRHPTVKTALAKKLLAKAKKKAPSLPVVGEKSPKRFILPTMSVRSSRIIKPNKRLFADFTDIFSRSNATDMFSRSNVLGVGESSEVREDSLSFPSKRLDKLTRRGRGSHKQFLTLPRSRGPGKSQGGPEGVGRDRMRRTISLYTEAITGPSKGQVGRPPKRRLEAPQQEVEVEVPDSPQRCDPKESRVKEKIEKLLRSPWDNRLKQSVKVGKCEGEELMPAPTSSTSPGLSASALSRNILRKARLNLNKSTLQKIRNPASLQRLIPLCDEGSVEGKCTICDIAGENSRKFNIVFCEVCSSFLGEASDGPKEIFVCQRTKGDCQIQILMEDDRCAACWLYRILTSCSMPSLLHDRLRKRLPSILKDQIPTSLARSMNTGSVPGTSEKDAELASHMKRLPLDPGGGGAFGSIMDLPGGWRRKTGPETIVISPSGEKFKSVQKLEEFLNKQGISADARILFGNSTLSTPPVVRNTEGKSKLSPTIGSSSGAKGKVVKISLPGGWIRRIKWRLQGNRFDTYVDSPDGRMFRSRRELRAYFQIIGKVDDIHKYFPVVSGYSDASVASSSETPGSSSTEPVSSSELCSEASDKSPEASECETAPMIPPAHLGRGKPKASVIKQLKMKSKKEKARLRSKSLSKLKFLKNSEAESEGQEKAVTDKIEVKSIERKPKKQKTIQRTRSLSVGRKSKNDDVSLTDTTESESEQKKMTTNTLFSKAFTRGRSKKAKVLHSSPPLFGKEIPPSSVISDKVATSPDSFQDVGNKEVDSSDLGNETKSKKPKKTEEETPISVEVNDIANEKKDPKIVLKIPKKALKIKPIKDKQKKKKKFDKKTVAKSKESCLKVSKVQDNSEVEPYSNKTPSPSSNIMPEETQGTVFGHIANSVDSKADAPTVTGMSPTSKATSSPNASEGEAKQKVMRAPDVKKPRSKKYSTYHLGNGWSRRVRWNEKGEGRTSLLFGPDGQTFRSRFELLAYFRKTGSPRENIDYYYPPVIRKTKNDLDMESDKDSKNPLTESSTETIATSTSAQSSEMSELSDSDAFLKTSEDSCISGDESQRPRISQVVRQFRKSITQPEMRGTLKKIIEESPVKSSIRNTSSCAEEGRKLVSLPSKGGRNIVVSIKEIKPAVKSESEEVEAAPEAGGPRVKHVCRSQAQVLGIPRAVFPPSPKKEEERINGNSAHSVVKGKQKRKIVTVTTTASGKVLRKTQWCSKCPGCTTPNCLKCSNCLDMKKYGGPGTKKKPCIMRKCHNPRLSIKSTNNQESNSKVVTTPTATVTVTTTPTVVAPKETVRKVKVVTGKLQEEKKVQENDTAAKLLLQDKGVFIPRQMTRTQPDQKDRGDIAAGKQFVPGALVNIDYWQGYDADEMMLTGYPVTTASPLHPQVLCFRCGSVGKEQLLYCAWCCEGIHPYCLEDGEGPECEVEEVLWICRRCAVCHVCGAPGADSLLRCSDCRNYYHLECLGPLAHSTCQPTPDRPWEADLLALLGKSWPHQPAIYDVRNFDSEGGKEDIVMHTELDTLKVAEEDGGDDDAVPDIIFLPSIDSESIPNDAADLIDFTGTLGLEEDVDFDAIEDSICLEDSLVELFRDADLYKPEPSPTANPRGDEVVSMREDEYLYLGYKKECEYPSRKIEMSYFRLLQIIHNEHFDALGYPTWRELKKKGLVEDRATGCGSGSDTDSASEGASDSDEESDLDWEEIFENRRYEAAQEMKEREDKRREIQRKKAEIKKEKARLERQKELEREAREKENVAQAQASDPVSVPKFMIKRKKKRGRPPGSLNKSKCGDEDFVVLDDVIDIGKPDDPTETPRRKRCRQPKSWEEFDKLFALLTCTPTSEDNKIKPKKILHSDNGIIGRKPNKRVKLGNLKLKASSGKLKCKAKKLKAMSGRNNSKVKGGGYMKEKVKLLNGKKVVKTSKSGTKNNLKVKNKKPDGTRKHKLGDQHCIKKKSVVSNDVKKKGKVRQNEIVHELKRKKKMVELVTLSEEDIDDLFNISKDLKVTKKKTVLGKSNLPSDTEKEIICDKEDADEDYLPTSPVSRCIVQDDLGKHPDLFRKGDLKVVLTQLSDILPGQESLGDFESLDLEEEVAPGIFVSRAPLPGVSPSLPHRKHKRKENDRDKENVVKVETRVIENGFLTPPRPSQETAGASAVGEDGGDAHSSVGGRADKRAHERDSGIITYELPEKRKRRTIGRASELASQRKAMLDN